MEKKFFADLYNEKIPQAYRKWGKQLDGKVEQFTFQAEEPLKSGSWMGVQTGTRR